MTGEGFGKLVLIQKDAPEREFGLSKANITIGRALTNDIVLADTRASRAHAMLSCGADGCEIVDLGSSNGTRVNGSGVERTMLRPGDLVSVGSSQLRYEFAALSDDVDATRIDTEADLHLTMDREILPMSINETGVPRLVIHTENDTWEIVLDNRVDTVTIGRDEANEIAIDHPLLSRRHARFERGAEGWIVRDLKSTNGTWFQGERLDERALQEGDVVRVGRAQIVFKDASDAEPMTRADEAFTMFHTRRPIVFVPGLLGSELWQGNERMWPSIKRFLTEPEFFRYPSPLEARGIVDEVVIVPNLIKQDQYNRLGDYLVEDLGYQRGRDFFEFPYDWRQDVRASARELAAFVEALPHPEPVTLIAHSLGTLVSRYYVERLGGQERVERAMLMGGPHQGTVKALTFVLSSPNLLPFGLLGERLRRVLASFPSYYQILPPYACGVDGRGEPVNFLTDESWAEKEHLALLRAARQFRRELGTHSSIPAISIFGYGIKTVAGVSVKRRTDGSFGDIAYNFQPNGDDGILEKSAILPGSEIHPVRQHHGALFVDNDVKMRLKLELARQFPSH
ncbi:MAG TPA: alpha/beta fold hydrolase [Anaerolineae bacterium]|nr:alpha/beta fold hydrolase [Anaerolineae bacterium]